MESVVEKFQKTNITQERHECFNHIYEEFKDVVYRRAVAYTQSTDDAYDISQNIWIKIYKGLDNFKNNSTLSTWIFRIASNECVNFLKSRKMVFSSDAENFDEKKIPLPRQQ